MWVLVLSNKTDRKNTLLKKHVRHDRQVIALYCLGSSALGCCSMVDIITAFLGNIGDRLYEIHGSRCSLALFLAFLLFLEFFTLLCLAYHPNLTSTITST
jgi:hypothetical protein